MNDPNLLAQIIKSVRKVTRIPGHVMLTAETRLVDDLRIDSLDLFAVVIEIQDRFDIIIDVEDMPEIDRIGDLANYVALRRASAAA